MLNKALKFKTYSIQPDRNNRIFLTPSARKIYAYWRNRVLVALIFGYAAFYLVRLNFSMAIPAMMAEFGFSKAQFGAILSAASIIYGAGRFINGYLCDRTDARLLMSFGLLGCAVMNLFMGFGKGLTYFALCWALNSYLQSMGSPAISKSLSHWFSPTELGTKWGIWNSSHQIGGAAVFIMSGYLISHYNWQYAFYVPGILATGLAVLLFTRMRETPQKIGLPPIEVYSGLTNEIKFEEKISSKELFKSVLTSKTLWCVSLGNMFLYIVRIGVFNWAPTFLKEMKGLSLLASGWQSAGFELAGLIGGLVAGWISDKLFHARRGPVSVLYMLALALALIAFWYTSANNQFLSALLMFGMGFMVYGPQVLAVVAAADFSSKQATGLANGLAGIMGYVGGAMSGLGVGIIADYYGWEGSFIFFISAAILGAFAFLPTWNKTAQVIRKAG